jgi:hypothetical protein
MASRYPGLVAQRGAALGQCLAEGSTSAVRDRLTLLHRVNWTDMERVAAFLRDQDLRDGELTSFSLPTVVLYGELGLAPSTRYIFLQDHLDIFRKRRSLIEAALVNSRQRYVVCDLGRYNMDRIRKALDGNEPASDFIAFRAGNYVVLRLTGPEMPAWLKENFGP